jgi:hypothetical protein
MTSETPDSTRAGFRKLTTAPRFSHADGAVVLHVLIAERAYSIWQSRGCPTGTSLRDWLQAEAEVRAEIAQKRRALP